MSKAALPAALDAKLRRDLPVAPEVFISALVRLGFASGQPETIYARLLEFYAGQVLGFYEPHGDELVLIDIGHQDPGDELVWAHELEHAAQQQRFKLASRLLAMRDNSDQQRASSAIAEGEALLVMFLLERGGGASELDVLANAEKIVELTDGSLPVPEGLPEYFVRELEFPYTTGFTAVLRAFRSGGWDAVDALLTNPPATTTELLHPGRVVTRTPISDRDLPGVPAGYEEVLTDTLGEWALGFWLSRLCPAEEAEALAAAWDGDRMRLVRKTDDHARWALAWTLRCSSEPERRRLQPVLAKLLPALLANLEGSGRAPELTWSSAGRELSLLAAWPQGPPPASR